MEFDSNHLNDNHTMDLSYVFENTDSASEARIISVKRVNSEWLKGDIQTRSPVQNVGSHVIEKYHSSEASLFAVLLT